MGKNTSTTESLPVTTQMPRSRVVATGIVVATKAFTLVAVLVAYYVIAFFAAIRVVPLTMGFVKSGTGVTLDMPIETVLSVWIVPALFLVALVFTLVLVTMRALWRLRTRAVAAVRGWAFGAVVDGAALAGIAPKNAEPWTQAKAGTKTA